MSTINFTESFEPLERSSVRSGQLALERVSTPIVGLRILLAEDTEINRQLAIHLLTSHGHAVVAAENGREAIETLEQRQFDVVLMDVQMPEMDGFDATASIREKERTTGAHIPIIAMTAHAMKGDRERCLAAGMDSYVSKPIRPKELFKVIDEVVPGSVASSKTNRKESTIFQEGSDPMQLDCSDLLASVNGNAVILSKLVALFLRHYPKMIAELHDAINQGDGDWLARASHTLRGGSGSFLTASARTALTSLETMGKTGRTDESDATLARLETEMSITERVLAGFVTKAKP